MRGGSNKLLTAAEAAGYLRFEVKYFRSKWRGWGIRGYRVGRELRFRERDLDNWIERREITA